MPDPWWFVGALFTIVAWVVLVSAGALCGWTGLLVAFNAGHWLYEKLGDECDDCRKKRQTEMGLIDRVITTHDAVEILERAPRAERQRAIEVISRGGKGSSWI